MSFSSPHKEIMELTRADRVIKFIEEFCRVPEGSNVGERIVLAEFQKSFIRAIYDNPDGTLHAYLCIARKNGKTALIAAIFLAHLVGPEAVLNSQIVSGAMSRDQASLVFKLAVKMVDLEPRLGAIIKYTRTSKMMVGRWMNTEYRALSAEAGTAHGLSPSLIILDEVGQVKGPTSPFIEALTTSQGAHDNPLLIAISTSSPSDADMFSIWVDDAIRSDDPHTVCHVYKADEDSDLMDEEQWEKANPAMGLFRSKRDLAEQMAKAKRLPSMEAAARNLLLNQRVALDKLWMAPSVWKSNNGTPSVEVLRKGPVSLGLDLSARADLTAAVLAAADENTGEVHLVPFVFTPRDGIMARSLRDRVPYQDFVRDGHMYAVGNKSIDYEDVIKHLIKWTSENQVGIDSLEFDRWRIDVFRKSADDLAFAQSADWHEVGQGYRDFSPRCDVFMNLALEGKIRHDGHPLLTMAAANAIAVLDAAGSVKLDKSKSTQRIDPLIAAVMAVYPLIDGSTIADDVSAWIV